MYVCVYVESLLELITFGICYFFFPSLESSVAIINYLYARHKVVVRRLI